ncbi:hypothetical protein CCAX7_57770 [Capsulimonas corticalis]|uniref:Uncharacterized protein n=1 Tax=Capsulimonas corticalis TaxID=2219043 RepID=A0A402D044_9BACT|nr:hypothetical protein CCAX7_57770 [Capsulimonas corticalis]
MSRPHRLSLRSDSQFRLLVESVEDYAIFLLDVDGYIVTWNRGAQRIKGYNESEIIGRHFSTFYTPEDIARDHPAEELEIAIAEGRYEEEAWRVRKDGSRFWANVIITALKDESGQHCGFAKVTRDVTARRNAEESKIQQIREQISRVFLREVLFSVTEGRLRFCENVSDLPEPLPHTSGDIPFGYTTLASVRYFTTEAAAKLHYSEERIHDLITAASEAAMNAVVHAQKGICRISWSPEGSIQVSISDHGPGIELSLLHRATLERGYSTENSLGHGFWLMLQTCDRVWIHSAPEGSIVVLEQDKQTPDPGWLSMQK